MDKAPNVQIRQLCEVTKGVDKKMDEGVLQWFSHVERMENNRIAKRVYVEVCAGSCSVYKLWKRWTDYMKECLKKRGLDVRQVRRMVHDRCVWQGFVWRNEWGTAHWMNP